MNPFWNTGAIENPDYFYNRKAEVDKLLSFVANRISCSVYGNRKIGKSSLAKYVIQLYKTQKKMFNHPNLIWIYIDFQQIIPITKSDFWKLLVKEIIKKLKEFQGVNNYFADLGNFESLLQESNVKAIDFGDFLVQLNLDEKDIQLVIVMDEFEASISNHDFDLGFYGALRSFVPKLTYVTLTQNSLYTLQYRETSTVTSPFFNIFASLTLELFSHEGAENLLLGISKIEGNPFSIDDINFLIALSGYHPFFLQRAAYFLYESRFNQNHAVDITIIYDDVSNKLFQEASTHFHYYWSRLSETQKQLISKFAEQRKVSMASLTNQEKLDMNQLAEQSLVFSDEESEKYQLFSNAFHAYIVQKNGELK